MAVFDKGGFGERERISRSQLSCSDKINTKEWDEGFKAGYEAALHRYIALSGKGQEAS